MSAIRRTMVRVGQGLRHWDGTRGYVALNRLKPNIDSAGELLSRGCQRRKGCDIWFQ